MSIHNFDLSIKQISLGNILLIICCVFYLSWWLVAFKPEGTAHGVKTGLLLVPAFAAGIAAVILAVKGISSSPEDAGLFSKGVLLWGGIAAYVISLLVTGLFFKRPITTELFLIIGWAVMAMSEINTLYGLSHFSYFQSVIFIVVILAATVVSLVCYVLYYNLGGLAGYVDGIIPLLLVALVTAGISVTVMI